jgi:ABC-type proline/glycine betaine transport system ATPase subunit
MIRFKNVSLKRGNKQLFKNFELRIGKGDKILLSAQSGSGKTTLLRLILGFIDPDEGKILFKQKKLAPENFQKIRKHFAYLSQEVDFPNGKVRDVFQEIFQFPANRHLGYTNEKLLEKLHEYNLPDEIMNKNTSIISGGERQRLGWIMVMLLDRPVLLLDEPTSAMDDKQKQRFIDFVAHTKKTVVCVSHDPDWQFSAMKVISTLKT